MSRKLFIVMVALFASVALAATLVIAADPPAGKVMLDKAKTKKNGVEFDHGKHSKELVKDAAGKPSCVECHHEAKDEAAIKAIKSCFECHNGGDAKATEKMDAKSGKKNNPFHKNCVEDCHKKNKKGPTKCKECHGGGDDE